MMGAIDLNVQLVHIRNQIDAAIQRVLSHGQCVLGLEVAELEEKLAATCAATGLRYQLQNGELTVLED
jgi:UDP-2-acetamido-2-deoxy-ribo-hexuluronate aminotransferase